jgi:hypothetical protein
LLSIGSTAEALNRLTTKQRAINLFTHLVQRGVAQTEEFAMQNGKGVKEREGDDLNPEQR